MKNPALIAEISEAELAVRMCEANYGIKRPPGLSAEEALAAMDQECRDGWRRSVTAAMDYWRECIEAAQRPN